jgi:hypothetical protein
MNALYLKDVADKTRRGHEGPRYASALDLCPDRHGHVRPRRPAALLARGRIGRVNIRSFASKSNPAPSRNSSPFLPAGKATR